MMVQDLKMIACINDNRALGRNNQLLYDIPTDKRLFRMLTLDKCVIMGHKTYVSLPPKMRPLPRRMNIVMSRGEITIPGCIVCHTVEEALEYRDRALGKDCPTFVIGGAQVYKTFLPYCDYAYITHVKDNADGDAYFPDLLSDPEWRMSSKSDGWLTEKSKDGKAYEFRLETYMRSKTIKPEQYAQASCKIT